MNEIIVNLKGKEYQIDIEKAKELGVLKEKDSRCKSWKEFRQKYKKKEGFYCDDIMNVITIDNPFTSNEQLTENEAIAIKAFDKLLKLRRDWIEDWEPNITDETKKYGILNDRNDIVIYTIYGVSHPFLFPTEEMAKEFLEYFKNLFEQCKNLI